MTLKFNTGITPNSYLKNGILLKTDLIKPMMAEISHCFQFSLTVEVNFPRNSIMMT